MALDFKMETNVLIQEKKFEWTIKQFSKLPDVVESPSFFPFPGYAFKWNVILEFEDKCNLVIFKMGCSDEGKSVMPPMKAKGTISVKNAAGSVYNLSSGFEFDIIMKRMKIATCAEFYTLHRFPSDITKDINFRDDIVIVEFKMTIFGPLNATLTQPPFLYQDHGKDSEILKLIYKRNDIYDFTFQFGKELIGAHKLILRARSPVFEKMFEHDTLENQRNSMTVEDSDFQVFKHFIRYLYTWEIEEDLQVDFEMLIGLYELADKYQLSELVLNCSHLLYTKCLKVSNVCNILQVADMHHDQSFKDSLMQFASQHFSEIRQMHGWSNFVKNNVELAAEIVTFISNTK